MDGECSDIDREEQNDKEMGTGAKDAKGSESGRMDEETNERDYGRT